MALAKKVCRVCGNSYEACKSAKKEYGVFVWQEVACSPECGVIYLKQINESRAAATAIDKPVENSPKKRRKKIDAEPDEQAVAALTTAEG
jgi:hypothetical protein